MIMSGKLTVFLVILTAALFVSFSANVLDAADVWTQTSGPTGGSATAVVSSGTSLFAGTWGGGVYRSRNAGASWARLNNGLSGSLEVVDVAVAGGGVFVATSDAGVFRSTDDGQTWTAVNTGLGDLEVLQLIARDDDDLLVLIGSLLGADLYISYDQGSSWDFVPSPTPLTVIVAEGPVILGNSAFAIGLFRTSDDGANWELLPPNGLTTSTLDEFVVSGTSIYGARIASSPGSVFVTSDYGDNWSELSVGIPSGSVEGLGIHGSVLFVISGPTDLLFRSFDGGATWESVGGFGLETGQGRLINRLGAHGADTFVATEKGLFRSADLGDTWQSVNNRFIATRTQALAGDGQMLYATVAHVPHEPINSVLAKTLALDTVFRSPDRGATWLAGHAGLPDGCNVRSLAVKGTQLFAGTAREGVYRSTDQGVTWSPARNGLPEPYSAYGEIDHLVANGTSLFAATRPRSVGNGRTQGGGIYRSDDNGASWFAVNNGIPLLGEYNPPYSYTYYPHPIGLNVEANTLFFGTKYNGVFRSTDSGDSWTEVNSGLPINNGNYPRFTSFVRIGADIFASSQGFHAGITDGRGVFRSSDGGLSWTRVAGDLADDRPVNALTVSGTDLLASVGCSAQPHELAGCEGSPFDGAYRSSDGGVTWERIGSQLDGVSITSMLVQGSHIFAGSQGYGIWRLRSVGERTIRQVKGVFTR